MDVNRLISGEHGFFAVLATKRPHGSALQDGLPKDIISLCRRLRLTAPPLTLSWADSRPQLYAPHAYLMSESSIDSYVLNRLLYMDEEEWTCLRPVLFPDYNSMLEALEGRNDCDLVDI